MNQTTPSPQNKIGANELWQYVQTLEDSTIARLSQPASPEVLQLMERNIQSILGILPSEHFEVVITTNREQLGQLLASAMLNGYFLKTVEQRMALENQIGSADLESGDLEAGEASSS
ncbi:DUF760 domain-containing protein [Lyngbya confervoides]|uniref:DUF760 domain-containing protein n=1 Tax=Lyngbya confervoides BDU141951 TaxID=1574623 RepID=A0ABD4T242_9CYAN|nr:DUF760 domain-containing protein [Lyngbya confervoides]MCM1982758.1 DUF760 domain-containing protein [Lyngbya confervoides BDU141951]